MTDNCEVTSESLPDPLCEAVGPCPECPDCPDCPECPDCPDPECPPSVINRVFAGVTLASRFELNSPVLAAHPGVAVSIGEITARTPAMAGVALSARADGELQKMPAAAGVRLAGRFDLDGSSTRQMAGAALVHIRYDLLRLSGATVATNDGPDNWTNPTNAQGKRDTVVATRSGQALSATNGNLRLHTYPPYTAKTDLTITLVRLLFSTRQTGTALNNGGLHHEYRLASSGAWTPLEVFTNNQDFIANPARPYDITTAVGGSWALLADLEVRVRAVLVLGTALVQCACDAVEVEVTAELQEAA